MGWDLNEMSDPILNPPPKAAKRLATVFQKPWRLATEVRWGLNGMTIPILNPPPNAAKWGCLCVPKVLAACNGGGMGFKWDDDSNPKHRDTPKACLGPPKAGPWPCNCVRKPMFLRVFLQFFAYNSKTNTLLLRRRLVVLNSFSKIK